MNPIPTCGLLVNTTPEAAEPVLKPCTAKFNHDGEHKWED